MKIAVVGLLVPCLVRASQFTDERVHVDDGESAVQTKNVSNEVTPGHSGFLLVPKEEEQDVEEENVDDVTSPSSSDLQTDWGLFVGNTENSNFVVPENRISIYDILYNFFFAIKAPAAVTDYSVDVVSEDQLVKLMEVSNFDPTDINLFLRSTVIKGDLLEDLMKEVSIIGKLKVFLRYDHALYAKFLERNIQAIKDSVIDRDSFIELVLTLIYGKSDSVLLDIMAGSEFSIGVDSFVIALLSIDIGAFFEVVENPVILNSPRLDWACFSLPASSSASDRIQMVFDFALESPFALVKADFVAKLLEKGADPSRNEFASIKVAVKNCAFDSFILLTESKPIASELANQILNIAAEAGCFEVFSKIANDFKDYSLELSPAAAVAAMRSRKENLIKAAEVFPVALPSKKFNSFLKASGATDEEVFSIILRRSVKPAAALHNLLKEIAFMRRQQLFYLVVSDQSLMENIKPEELTKILNLAIKFAFIDSVELLSGISSIHFDKNEFDAFQMLQVGNLEAIRHVSRLGFPWNLDANQITTLANSNLWDSLTAYVKYSHSAPIKNSISILKLAIAQNQIPFVRACLLNRGIQFPKDPASLATSTEMKALFAPKK